MRWSCPHCGINLAVSDDKMGSGWSFSRCYKCGGFALVRRAEINLVKVDRAPAGEHIILPEASEEPETTMMSQEATENLARLRRESAEKAAIRQAARAAQQQQHLAMADAIQGGRAHTQPLEPRITNAAPPPVNALAGNGAMANTAAAGAAAAPAFPQPMPEMPLAAIPNINGRDFTPIRARARFLPVAIGIAAVTAIGSGMYLYDQGQTLWEKARVSGSTAYELPDHLARPAPVRHSTSMGASQALTDQVHANAMAPVRGADMTDDAIGTSASSPTALSATTTTTANGNANGVGNGTASSATSRTVTSVPALTEEARAQLRQIQAPATASAPAQVSIAPTAGEGNGLNRALVVKLRHEKGMLRSGPGTNYPIIGKASPDQQYRVIDWNDRWFRVMMKDETGKSAFAAWIRTDLVQVVPQRTTKTQ